jgi:DNA repair protein RadC
MDWHSLFSLFQVNEIEIVYRNRTSYSDRIQIRSASTAYEILRQSWDINRLELVEQFKILLLNQQNNCLSIAAGGMSSCGVDPKVIFTSALKARATSLILAHNHPSGSLQPSEPDKLLTRKLNRAANCLISPFSIISSLHPAIATPLPMMGSCRGERRSRWLFDDALSV